MVTKLPSQYWNYSFTLVTKYFLYEKLVIYEVCPDTVGHPPLSPATYQLDDRLTREKVDGV